MLLTGLYRMNIKDVIGARHDVETPGFNEGGTVVAVSDFRFVDRG